MTGILLFNNKLEKYTINLLSDNGIKGSLAEASQRIDEIIEKNNVD